MTEDVSPPFNPLFMNQAIEACIVGVVVADMRLNDQPIVYVNPAFKRLSGYPAAELLGRNCRFLQGHDHGQPAVRELRQAINEGRTITVTLRNYRKDGTLFHNELTLSPIHDHSGSVTHYVGFQNDVTAREEEYLRKEQILQLSEQNYRRIAADLQRTLDLSLDLITSIGPDGQFVTVNGACTHLLGYTPEELIGRHCLDFIHPDDRGSTLTQAAFITNAEAIHNAGEHTTALFQNRYLHKNGTTVWMEWATVVLPGDPLMYGVARDVTQRRAAQEDQAYLAAIVQASQDAIVGLSRDGTIRSWNTGAERLYEYTAAEAVGEPITMIVPAEFHEEQHRLFLQSLLGEQGESFESLQTTKSGHQIPVMITGSPIIDTHGQVLGVSRIARDIRASRAAATQISTLNASLQQQLRHITGLREIDQAIASSTDLSVTLGLLLDHLLDELGGAAASILLLDPHTLLLESAVTRGFSDASLQDSAVKLGEGLAGRVALSRQAMNVPDLSASLASSDWSERLKKQGLTGYFAVPLIVKGEVLGVTELFYRQTFVPSSDWRETLDTLTSQATIAVENAQLFQRLEESNLELRLAYDATIEGWAQALDLRDKETEGHSRRVTEMTVTLCKRLGISPEELVDVRRGALLHDIGKMGIPDGILLKPGKLTDEEWVEMRKHPGYAVDLLSPIRFLRPALDIPQYHHEKWDGSGYPFGLQGKSIPLTARAFAVVDVYDALTNDRPYRTAWTPEKALAHIQNEAGTHFDTQVVQVFSRMLQSQGLA